jgi:hypothetical protein
MRREASIAFCAALLFVVPAVTDAAPVIVTSGFSGASVSAEYGQNLLMYYNIGSNWTVQVVRNAQIVQSIIPAGSPGDFSQSNYGIISDAGGLWVYPRDGSTQQLIWWPNVNGNGGNSCINDEGDVCWAARPSVQTGLDQLFYKPYNGDLMQLQAPLGGTLSVGNLFIDCYGRVYANLGTSLSNTPSSIFRYYDGSWEDLHPAGQPGSWSAGCIDSIGARMLMTQNYNGYSYYYSYDHGQTTFVAQDSNRTTGYLADNNSVLVSFNSKYYNDPPSYYHMYLPDDTYVDLATVVPSGMAQVIALNMNRSGQVLLKTTESATGHYDYYIYDGYKCYPMMTGLSQSLGSPVLGGDGWMYYTAYDSVHSCYNEYAVQTPEPASLSMLLLGGLAVLKRRERAAAALG